MLYGLRDARSRRLWLISDGSAGLPELLDAWDLGESQLVARRQLRDEWYAVGPQELRRLRALATRERQERQRRLTAELE